MKNKSKSVDLRTLWDRAAKIRKMELGSSLVPHPVTVESDAQPQNPLVQTDVPLTNESQVHHESTEPETEIASNDPNIASTEPKIANNDPNIPSTEPSTWSPIRDGDDSKYQSVEVVYDIDHLSHDLGKRIPIKRYSVNEQNYVVKTYIALGPCQPWNHDFPIRNIGGKPRRFLPDWFDEFRWLEYSVEKDAAFCFVCYLFKHKLNSSSAAGSNCKC